VIQRPAEDQYWTPVYYYEIHVFDLINCTASHHLVLNLLPPWHDPAGIKNLFSISHVKSCERRWLVERKDRP
jgi:hypothetical protein